MPKPDPTDPDGAELRRTIRDDLSKLGGGLDRSALSSLYDLASHPAINAAAIRRQQDALKASVESLARTIPRNAALEQTAELIDVSRSSAEQIAALAQISSATLTVLQESARQADAADRRIARLTAALTVLTTALVALTYILAAEALHLWPFAL